jgi:hypothetical protein
MPKYDVVLVTSASTVVTVEADSIEEAREAALGGDVDMPSLCHQCAGGGRGNSPELILGDEWDVPTDFPLSTYITEADA